MGRSTDARFAVNGLQHMLPTTLELVAADAADAGRLARQRGIEVLSVRPLQRSWSIGSGAAFPLLQFNQSLLVLLNAGLSIVEAIETLAEREGRTEVRRTLLGLSQALGTGQSLSAAMEAAPAAFPALYVATVRAHERSGALSEAVTRFIHYRQQADQLRKRLVAASIYPALILAVGGLVIGFLLFYVVPRFSRVFEDMGDRVPWLSRLLLDWGTLVHAHGGALLLGALLVGGVGAALLSQPAVRAAFGRRLLGLPTLGGFVRVYRLAHYYRALGMLLKAGIPILSALDMVGRLLPEAMQAAHAQARRLVSEGQPLSSALDGATLTTVVSLRLLRVGERSGQLGEMLERSAGFHDEEISQAIDWLVRLFEPLLMVVIGGVIGVVVLLMYAPIFELAGSVQ